MLDQKRYKKGLKTWEDSHPNAIAKYLLTGEEYSMWKHPRCGTCIFLKNTYCKYWKLHISRKEYICGEWSPLEDDEIWIKWDERKDN